MKTLKDIRKTDDNAMADDDHLNRPDITKKEFDNAVDELIDEHELKPKRKKRVSPFAAATVDALKKLKIILVLFR